MAWVHQMMTATPSAATRTLCAASSARCGLHAHPGRAVGPLEAQPPPARRQLLPATASPEAAAAAQADHSDAPGRSAPASRHRGSRGSARAAAARPHRWHRPPCRSRGLGESKNTRCGPIFSLPSLFGTGDFFGTVPSFGWYSDRAPVLQESSTLLVLGASSSASPSSRAFSR